MLSCWGMEAAIAVGCGTAVNTAFFVMVVLMEPAGTLRAAVTIFGRFAKDTFGSHNISSIN